MRNINKKFKTPISQGFKYQALKRASVKELTIINFKNRQSGSFRTLLSKAHGMAMYLFGDGTTHSNAHDHNAMRR